MFTCILSEWNISVGPSNVSLNYLYSCRGLRGERAETRRCKGGIWNRIPRKFWSRIRIQALLWASDQSGGLASSPFCPAFLPLILSFGANIASHIYIHTWSFEHVWLAHMKLFPLIFCADFRWKFCRIDLNMVKCDCLMQSQWHQTCFDCHIRTYPFLFIVQLHNRHLKYLIKLLSTF